MNPVSYIRTNQAMIIDKMNHAFDTFEMIKLFRAFAYNGARDYVEGSVSVGAGVDDIMTLRYSSYLDTKEKLEWEFNGDIASVYFNAMRNLGKTQSRHNFKIEAINLEKMIVSVHHPVYCELEIPLKNVSESECVYDGKTLHVSRIDALLDKEIEEQIKRNESEPPKVILQSTSGAVPEAAPMPMPNLQLTP